MGEAMSDYYLVALRAAELAIEAVIEDEETEKAGLWRGERLPRTLRILREAISRLEQS
jgi:hypothetical protein